MKDRTHASMPTRADFIVRPLVLRRASPAGHATVTAISIEDLRCLPDPLVFNAGDFRAPDEDLLRQCLEYERKHRNRKGIIQQLQRRIRKLERQKAAQ